ncbi:hypothetical protein CR513_50669, partial [Mucuna pruriens]
MYLSVFARMRVGRNCDSAVEDKGRESCSSHSDLKVKNYLFHAIDRPILETILCKDTSKDIWDSMKKKYQGSVRAKRQQLQTLRSEFETLRMKSRESVTNYFSRTMAIANKMRIHGDKTEDITVVEKILQSMTLKFNFVVCSIEEAHDIEELSIDELQSSLLIHEKKINQQEIEEQALKVSTENRLTSRGERGQGRGRGKGIRGKSRGSNDHGNQQEHTKVSKQSECQTNLNKDNGEKTNFAEKEEEVSLLMVCHVKEETQQNMWYLDTGCSNHMCGNKMIFSDLDEIFCNIVKFGDNSTVSVLGKGTNDAWLCHFRYGHLNFSGLKTLWQKNMVTRLPQITAPSEILVEKEVNSLIKVLRSDRGGEYNSHEFVNFCETHGIKRQLTAAYTPQQNGVCERKNRTIMNVVRSLLTRSGVAKTFWLEAVN